MMKTEMDIFTRNMDVEHIVNAAANIGHYACGRQVDKRFALLISTDIHISYPQMRNIIEYLNGMDALDAGICLGDLQGGDYAESDGTWYTKIVKQAEKPFFTVIGNHDGGNSAAAAISGTKEQVFNKFIAPVKEKIGIAELDKTYYAINFDEYKITLIVLDNFDVPDKRNAAGDFAISRGVEHIGQQQADWLVNTLSNIPEGYHLIVARHSYPNEAIAIPCTWTTENRNLTIGAVNGNTEMIPDIIDAWINGKSLKREYRTVISDLTPVGVEADFEHRGKGAFVGYIIGHEHIDWQGKSKKYPDQKIYCFASSASDGWQNYCSDLPRLKGTKAEDCFTVFVVDRARRQVILVRVGSNITNTMVNRTFLTLPY